MQLWEYFAFYTLGMVIAAIIISMILIEVYDWDMWFVKHWKAWLSARADREAWRPLAEGEYQYHHKSLDVLRENEREEAVKFVHSAIFPFALLFYPITFLALTGLGLRNVLRGLTEFARFGGKLKESLRGE